MNVFRIPDFSVQEIIKYFEDIQLRLSLSDIQKPSTQNLNPFYEALLEICPNIKIKDFEYQSESQYLILIFSSLTEFFRKIEISNYTLKDFIFPEHKRIVSFLSSILNFIMFRDSKQALYNEALNLVKEKEDFYETINLRKNELTQKLNALKSLKEKDQKEISKLEDLYISKSQILKQNLKINENIENEISELKLKKTELQDFISGNQFLKINLETEYKNLKTQVIKDPVKLVSLLNEMKTLVNKEKHLLSIVEAKIKHLGEQNASLVLVLKDLVSLDALFLQLKKLEVDITTKTNLKHEAVEKLSRLEGEIKQNSKTFEIDSKKLGILNDKLGKINEKKKVLEVEAQIKRDKIKETHENLLKMQIENEKLKSEKIRILDDLNKELRKLDGDYAKQTYEIKDNLILLKERIESHFLKQFKNL